MLKKLTRQLRKLAAALTHRDYCAALWRGGVAAAIEHERLLKWLNCSTVVDIGANRGQFALAARHSLPTAWIISFEPLPAAAKRFRSILGSDPRVTLHQVAVGTESGEVTIHVSAEDDSSSILPITTRQTSLFPGTHEAGREMIRIEPLDKLVDPLGIHPPALLKIDVQGYELKTLQGCESMLSSFAYLYVECSFVELYQGQALASDVIAYLQRRGFRLRGVYNVSYDSAGQAIQADILFAADSQISSPISSWEGSFET